MRPILIALTCMIIATPALAQHAPGSIGNGGRMPATMSPGALHPSGSMGMGNGGRMPESMSPNTLPPGSIGNGGRMPETQTPGALAPPSTMVTPSAPAPSLGHYPNTQSLSRERIESQGYHVDQMNQQLDGSWQGNVSRDPVPTRPQGMPSRITVFPDGRVLEERQP